VTTVGKEELAIMPGKGIPISSGRSSTALPNRISISGAVYRPGEYELKAGMTLRQLIAEADGLREDAFSEGDPSPTQVRPEPGDRILRRDKLLSGQMQISPCVARTRSRSIRNSILRKDIMWTYKAR